jgi:hypothetical protein
MDREADAVSIFDALAGADARFVIRLCHNRRLVRDSDDEPRLLFDALASGERMLTREVPLSRRTPTGTALRRTHPARAERTAKLRIQATTVTIKAPGQKAMPLKLNAVLVQEVGLTPRQVRLLQRLSTMKGPGVAIKMPPNPTAADALLAVARLGGHIANNGAPGWQVLGRGYDSMLLMELGWRAAQAPPGEM